MNVYDDVLDATVVTHSVTGHFTTSDYEELIIVKTNLLCVYSCDEGKLYLTKEFKVAGRITGLSLVSQRGSLLGCLVLSTAAAKLSVVRYDESARSLETLSLHYYEDELRDLSLLGLTKESQLRVEPDLGVAFLLNGDCIALLPLKTAKVEADKEDDEDNGELASIVLNANKWDKEIRNIIDIQFLNGFSKPTIGVLYQPKLAWAGNKKLVPLPTRYTILSLDINTSKNGTSLNAAAISKSSELMWDLHTILPLSNGCLLVGANELVYMDNVGALQSIIWLNSFADKQVRKCRIMDYSKQEIIFHSPVTYFHFASTETLDKSDSLLIMDHTNNMYSLHFDLEGRLLVEFDIFKLPIVNDIFKNNMTATCISCLNASSNKVNVDLFIGFRSGDALVVRLNNLKLAIDTYRERNKDTEMIDGTIHDIQGDEDEEQDDLYSHEDNEIPNQAVDDKSQLAADTVTPFNIEIMSSIRNIGPITSMAVGKASSVYNNVKGLPNPNKDEFSIVTTSGEGSGSHLTVIQPSVQPELQLALKFISVTQIWNLKIKNRDKFLVTTDSNNSKSAIYRADQNFALHKEGRFRTDDTTVFISMFGEGKRIVQATTNHLYLYDTSFRRFTTMKFEYEVTNVSVLDPYILVTLSRGDIKIYELDSRHKKKLFRVDLPSILPEMVLTFGVILKSNMCNEYLTGLENSDEEQLLFTFVTADNQIIFFPREHNDRVFQLCGVDQLNSMLYISTYQLPEDIVPDPSIKQVMINNLGHKKKEEYLTILTFGGEIYQYKKSDIRHSRFYRDKDNTSRSLTGAPENAYAKGVSGIERIMHYIPDYNGYSVIFVTGNVPYIIIKEDDSTLKVFKFANIPVVSMCRWGVSSVMCVDDIKNARVYTLDCNEIYYGGKLPIKRIRINDEMENYMTLTKVTYHERSQMYVVVYAKSIPYYPVGEDDNPLVGYKENVIHSKSFQSGILLINPTTWNIIDHIELEKDTLVSDMRTMIIQLDSRSKLTREQLIVGVSRIGNEDLQPTGLFLIYDLNTVVTETGKPDTTYKLEQIFKEEVKGTVSSVCEISGRFMVSQSQKVMVRDVQEDNSVVPVAFLDLPVFVTDIKSFGNLIIIGDSMQGMQFIGFDAEPYRMVMLGKSVAKLKTTALEFLVNHGDIFFSVADTSNILHILKYAPDEPNSLSGQRLVHCSSFNLLSRNNCMLLLPVNDEFGSGKRPTRYQSVGGQVDGSVFKVVPVKEDSYRRLYIVQQHLIDNELQLAGLNPKMERLSNDYYNTTHNVRPVLDFTVVKKFSNLPLDERQRISRKSGRSAHFNIWRDLIDVEFSMRSLLQ